MEKNFLGKFQVFARSPKEMVLYSWNKLSILKYYINIQSLRRWELRFWQISKQIYGKLQYKDKLLSKFQSLPCCLKKMVLYSSRKFHILELCTNIQSLRRFDLGLLEIPKHVYRSLQYEKPIASFSEKNDFVLPGQIWDFMASHKCSIHQNIQFRCLAKSKSSLKVTSIWGNNFWKVSKFASLFCIRR